jgi:hypothetical protein
MKLLVEVKENKAAFLLELLRNLPFVKATPITAQKVEVLKGLRTAVEELKQVKAGKLTGRPVQELLDEL